MNYVSAIDLEVVRSSPACFTFHANLH